ncbi:septum formation initiator family protein [Cryobacterium sp.]|jgi:cell division protein FtsB|uniref:FtsB family cell division protein n=1 Tax=Cryobacterium sp. TaxID=1926290 RepID=UPI00261BAEF3|nr:septum formation initiator family protein [Cryobacterium sp.]MCU1444385.1 Septum formation initiator [Cryobacterium sp.]
MTKNGSGMTPPRLPEPRRPTSTPAARSTATPGAEAGTATSTRATSKPTGKTRTTRQPVQLASTETAAGNWLRGLRLSGFSFVMMGILVLAVVVLAPSVRTYAEQRQQIDELRSTVAAQEAEVDNLKDERERWNDRTFVTTQARDRLSYVMPGDISFLVLNDTGATVDGSADTAAVSTAIQDTEVDWVDSMFRSVMTAGLAPQEAAE